MGDVLLVPRGGYVGARADMQMQRRVTAISGVLRLVRIPGSPPDGVGSWYREEGW
jgi:hypothetical protein